MFLRTFEILHALRAHKSITQLLSHALCLNTFTFRAVPEVKTLQNQQILEINIFKDFEICY